MDTSKHVFQLHAVNVAETVVIRKTTAGATGGAVSASGNSMLEGC
jgi:hypothetical protein